MTVNSKKIKGPKWLGSAFENIRSEIYSNRPIGGIGTQVFDSPGGRVINAATGKAGSSATLSSSFPFEIISVTGTGGTALGINRFSYIVTLAGITIPITGLLSDETDMSDPGWFACPDIGHKIWLQIGTANPNDSNHTLCIWPGTTKIQSGEAGGTLWEEYPDPISITGSGAGAHQEFYNLLLAEVTDPETDTRPAILTVTIGEGASSEKRQITQCWSRNVMPVTWEVNGLVGMVPIDPTLDYPPTPL